MSKNVVTLKSGLEVTQGHWNCYHSIDCVWFPITASYYVVRNMHHFWDIRLVTIQWPWNWGYGSLKVIRTDTDLFATYDFLLQFHCNHGPIVSFLRYTTISVENRKKFSHPLLFCIPAEGGSHWNCTGAGSKKTRMMGLPAQQRNLTISSADRMHKRDRQTDGHQAAA